MGLMQRLRQSSKAWAKTIVAFDTPRGLKQLGTTDDGRPPDTVVERTTDNQFKIRLAFGEERSRDASFLVQKRYSQVGYHAITKNAQQPSPEQITLLSYHQDKVVGTVTIGMDTGQGLNADELYKAEIDSLRAQGRKVCENTKLAVDTALASKRVLAALYHMTVIYNRNVWGYTDLVIEVNPSHVGFYTKMLGMQQIGPERLCRRVNAPAVLLWLDMEYVDKKVREVGGRPELAKQDRSLYPYFFSKEKELEITRRILQNEAATPAA